MDEPDITTTLADGTPVLLRPVDACDEHCLAAGFEDLSPRSRHFRFAAPLKRLSPAQLRYLGEVDNVNHAVIGARAVADGRGIGLGRYIRLAEEPEVAEMALTVIDDFQGRGLGRILLERLAERARANGIALLRGYVLRDNEPMIRLLEHVGARARPGGEGSLCFEILLVPENRAEHGRSAGEGAETR